MTEEMEKVIGRRMDGLHPLLLVEENADAGTVYDELTMQLSQARGLLGILTQLEHEQLIEAPNNALAQTAWSIDEQLEKVSTLARMLIERLNRASQDKAD